MSVLSPVAQVWFLMSCDFKLVTNLPPAFHVLNRVVTEPSLQGCKKLNRFFEKDSQAATLTVKQTNRPCHSFKTQAKLSFLLLIRKGTGPFAFVYKVMFSSQFISHQAHPSILSILIASSQIGPSPLCTCRWLQTPSPPWGPMGPALTAQREGNMETLSCCSDRCPLLWVRPSTSAVRIIILFII